MIYKYYVNFDDDGEIGCFCKFKQDCDKQCKEYVVKLIPIEREAEEKVEELDKAMDKTLKGVKKLGTELHRVVSVARRFK